MKKVKICFNINDKHRHSQKMKDDLDVASLEEIAEDLLKDMQNVQQNFNLEQMEVTISYPNQKEYTFDLVELQLYSMHNDSSQITVSDIVSHKYKVAM